MEQELQALIDYVDSIDPLESSVDWSRVQYSMITKKSLELFYTESDMESKRLSLVMLDKNPDFTVFNHHGN
jgi:hypothetical protein